jgi:hypothetical protein
MLFLTGKSAQGSPCICSLLFKSCPVHPSSGCRIDTCSSCRADSVNIFLYKCCPRHSYARWLWSYDSGLPIRSCNLRPCDGC